jgi:alpha-L-fucosidase 2
MIKWGSAFWWQNVRESYYPAIQAGDFDLLRHMFAFYQRLLPVQEKRVQRYYNHSGGYFEETTTLYGLMVDGVFGYLCDGTVALHGNPTIRLHFDGSLELCLLMVDFYRHTKDEAFVNATLLPICTSVLEFFRLHYTARDSDNRTIFFPSQSLETWQCLDLTDPAKCVTNSVVFISGVKATLQAVLSIPFHLTPSALRSIWSEQLIALPPLPLGNCPADPTLTCLMPGSRFMNETGNSENVELYAVWPYRLFGLGIKGSDMNVALANYHTRPFPCNIGWCQVRR